MKDVCQTRFLIGIQKGNMFSIREFYKTLTRSSGWSLVRKIHILKNPTCAVCGKNKKLQVHHIQDFSETPELELDPDNLITLCMGSTKCHFTFGHLGYWKSINPDIVKDSEWFLEKFKNRR